MRAPGRTITCDMQHSKAFSHSTLRLFAGQQAGRHIRQQSVILCQMKMSLKWWTMARELGRSVDLSMAAAWSCRHPKAVQGS